MEQELKKIHEHCNVVRNYLRRLKIGFQNQSRDLLDPENGYFRDGKFVESFLREYEKRDGIFPTQVAQDLRDKFESSYNRE